MKKLVVLTGAGVSAESGVSTFRDAGGLWEGHDVMEVASPEGWRKNRALVLDFYNKRRKQVYEVEPNPAHIELARLEADFDVTIITQNIDDLHERAGSSNVLHLHGEIKKVRSTADPSLIYDWGNKALKEGDKCEKGSQLRPHVVWFGEMVPMMEVAAEVSMKADLFMVVGTSMVVYPAASLIDFVGGEVPKFIIDPNLPSVRTMDNLYFYEENASTGVKKVGEKLREEFL